MNVRQTYLDSGFSDQDIDNAEPLFIGENHGAQRFGDYLTLATVERGGYRFVLGEYDGAQGPLLFGPELGDVRPADMTAENFENQLAELYPA